MNTLTPLWFLTWALCWALPVAADVDNQQSHGEYTVHYSVFNSTFLLPEVARANQLKRSKYENLVNILVTQGDKPGGVPAAVTGTTANMLQQQKTLKFKPIAEKGTVYYLAPVRVTNKEITHFEITVVPEGTQTPLVTKFTKTLHAE